MTWQSVILSLLSGITDPAERLDVARTVLLLLQAYDDGRISYDELRAELVGLFKDVIAAKNPDMSEEEVMDRAVNMAEEVIRRYRIQTSFRRAAKRLGARSI